MINQDTLESVSGWAVRTRQILSDNIDKLKVVETGEFKASLRVDTRVSGTQIICSFKFMLKGKFSDMGAGRGQSANTKKTKRKTKKWYSRAFYGRLSSLRGMIGYRVASEVVKSSKL
jgi:hypothetical protein